MQGSGAVQRLRGSDGRLNGIRDACVCLGKAKGEAPTVIATGTGYSRVLSLNMFLVNRVTRSWAVQVMWEAHIASHVEPWREAEILDN